MAAAALAGCNPAEEWGPVFGLENGSMPEEFQPVRKTANISIQDLCKTYHTGSPRVMTGNYIIEGKVISTDQPGNFYKSFYIQDETAGIEIKIGRNSLYSDYHEGQTIYIDCNDLWLGMYGYKDGKGQGMVQIGAKGIYDYEKNEYKYETTYLESPLMIDLHVFQGEMGDPVEPTVVTESQLPGKADNQSTNTNVGKLVTLRGLTYTDQVFVLLYPDSSRPHEKEDAENRLFLSPDDYGVKISNKDNWKVFTWAMSKQNIIDHLKAGDWDKAEIASGETITNTVSEGGMFKDCKREDGSLMTYKELLIKNAAAQSVSQYFKMGDTVIQLRTSGFCKFADVRIPDDVLDGSRKVNITGVLCMYQGSIQMVVNRLSDITYEDGSSLY